MYYLFKHFFWIEEVVLPTPAKGDLRTPSPFVEVDEGLALGLVKVGLSDFTGRWSLLERLEKAAPLSLWLLD